jgi:hypothetical protein
MVVFPKQHIKFFTNTYYTSYFEKFLYFFAKKALFDGRKTRLFLNILHKTKIKTADGSSAVSVL